jgi:hypothetical protein
MMETCRGQPLSSCFDANVGPPRSLLPIVSEHRKLVAREEHPPLSQIFHYRRPNDLDIFEDVIA